jgi:hypothetical protein
MNPQNGTTATGRIVGVLRTIARRVAAAAWLALAPLAVTASSAPPLAYPEVDAFNIRVGTQIFGPKYQFTQQNVLVEAAHAMLQMGSDTLKFALGWGSRGQYGLVFDGSITDLMRQARDQPETRAVLDLPFRHIFVWAHAMTPAGGVTHWTSGLTADNAAREYTEIYELTTYLLSNYSGTGKQFYLGHWEGDWWLLPNYNATVNPDPVRIQGMIDWLNVRQQAVDDARAAVPHHNVGVFQYTEVNRVRDAMVNGPANNLRLVNAVLPYVPALDYVSYSCYDAQNLSATGLHATLDFIEAHLGTAKSALIPGRRVFIGEYGWGKAHDSAGQEPVTRDFIRKVLNWGTPHILFWALYNNEPGNMFWLIDSAGNQTPSYHLHQRFANQARLEAGRFFEANGRLPDAPEFGGLMDRHLATALPSPPPIVIRQTHRPATNPGRVNAEAWIEAGVYGLPRPDIYLHSGTVDGGTDAANWHSAQHLGQLSTLQPQSFGTGLELPAGSTLFYRFRAVSGTAESWAESSGRITDERLDTQDFRYRMRVALTGFAGSDPVDDLPLMLHLHPAIEGFAAEQFAQPQAADLRVIAADGTTALPFTTAGPDHDGVVTIWIRVPRVTSTNDFIWLLWGNPRATIPPMTAAEFWAADQRLVLDFDDVAAPFDDRSGTTTPRTSATPPSLVAGVRGWAARFTGGSTYLQLPAFDPAAAFTLRAWLRLEPGTTSIQTLWSNKSAGWNRDGVAWFVNDFQTSNGSLILETGNGSTGAKQSSPAGGVSAGVWHHLAVAVDPARASATLYINGSAQVATGSLFSAFSRGGDWWLGRFADGSFPLNGTVDELHIDSTARSAAWIRNNHANLSDPGQYVSYGPVEQGMPALHISRSGTSLHLVWPDSAASWQLQSAPSVAPGAVWTAVAAEPQVRDGRYAVTLDSTALSFPVFFRLAQ